MLQGHDAPIGKPDHFELRPYYTYSMLAEYLPRLLSHGP